MAKVRAYGFGISRKDYQKYSWEVRTARGFAGMTEHPQGYICVFRTENDAKVCRNIMEYCGTAVGKVVFPVMVEEDNMRKEE